MSVLDNQTKVNPTTSYFGSGTSPNLDLSTLQLVAGNTSTVLETYPAVGRLQTFVNGNFIGGVRIDSTLQGVVLEVGSGSNEVILSGDVFYVPQLSTAQGLFSSIAATDIYAPAVSTQQLDIDGQVLTANPTDLLLNGVPLVTQSSLSSIADWSLDPAIANVDMANFDLLSTTRGFFSTVLSDSLSTGAIFANTGVFQDISTNTMTVQSTIHVISTISSAVLEVNQASVSTLYASDFLSTPDIEVSTINGAQFGNSSITVEVVGVSSLVANSISSIGAELRTALVSTLQFNPSFSPNLDVNLGLGSLFGNLAGAAAGGIGVVVGAAGLGTGIAALAQGRQTNFINSTSYELVNGTTQLQISSLGTSFSTIYRFVSSISPDVPGEEYFVSTVHAPGVAIRSLSDPLNTVSAPTSTIQSFGQWVALDANLPIPSTTSTFSELYTSSIQTSTIVAPAAEPIYVIGSMWFSTSKVLDGGGMGDGISGANLENWQNLNCGTIFADALSGLTTPYIDIFTDIKNTGYAISTTRLETSTLYLPSTLLQGNASFSEVLAINPGTQSTCQIAASFHVAKGNQNDTNFLAYGRNISNRAIIVDSNFSTQTLAYSGDNLTVSSLTFTGVSTVTFSTSTATGSAGQPSGRLVLGGNDLDIGQGDVWAQQIRLGAANPGGSAQTEIIFYSPDNLTVRGLGIGGQDRAIRTVSTVNGGTGGYLLDTNLNPPFFSTIGGQVNLMALFPSTNLSTIGASTLSIIPGSAAVNTSSIFTSSIQSIGNVSSINIATEQAYIQIAPNRNITAIGGDVFLQSQGGGVLSSIVTFFQSGDSAGGIGSFSNGAPGLGFLAASSIRVSTNVLQAQNISTNSLQSLSSINGFQLSYFASVYSSTTQLVAGANVSTTATWNTTSQNTGGFTIGTSTIAVPVSGTYEVNTSFQFGTSSGGTNLAQFWLTKNGLAVPQTNSRTTVANNADNLGTVSIYETATAGDTFGWDFYSADTNMSALAVAAGATPAIPSVIVNIRRLG